MIAWAVGAPDPMFRVLSVRTAPVHAALVSFPEPQYRNAVEVHTEPLVEPKAIEPLGRMSCRAMRSCRNCRHHPPSIVTISQPRAGAVSPPTVDGSITAENDDGSAI